ncbi:MAG TPA: efflux transporter outer membrane subunit [Verrucomicrobiae bacterium]|jgi:multidrug efflux system outer membrane protein|nr:efflux transporter outer membrane subunit [Verrucomicrobiae bacterium]
MKKTQVLVGTARCAVRAAFSGAMSVVGRSIVLRWGIPPGIRAVTAQRAVPTALALALVFAGCSVGPNYHRPAALPSQPLPKSFTTVAPGTNGVVWKVGEPSANVPRGNWWEVFGNSELDRLELLALTNNQNIASSVAQFEQARQIMIEARSEFYPQLTAGGTPNGDINRQHTSVNAPTKGQATGAAYTYNTFTAPVYLGWEIDLWGRVRRLSEGAHARYVASADDLESAKLDVAAEVADDFFTLRTLDRQYQLVASSAEDYRRSLELTENLRHGGAVSDLDVAQAATQLHAAEAQLPNIQLQRVQTLHALAILCGESPVDFYISTNSPEAATVPEIPPSVPSDLLEHRPDIASAERQMAAANADIGVAKAAFFPTIRINGLAGFESVDAGTWFNWSSRLWSVGPSIQLPLFTGFYNRANLAAARAAYTQQVANYRQTVLSAFGEVEDELAAQRLIADEWYAENQAVTAAKHALEIANNQYKDGLVTYLNVATAQTTALEQEDSAVQLEGARLTAAVNLIKALGCNWQAEH